MACHGKDFVILGADSRATVRDIGGTRVEINIIQKIIQVSKHSAILLYGESGQAQYLVEKYKKDRRNGDRDVSEQVEEFAELCQRQARLLSDVPGNPRYFPAFGFLIAGLDKKQGSFNTPRCYQLYSERNFRIELGREGFVMDGKPMLAYYFFAKKYDSNMELDPLLELIAQSLWDTSQVDGDVGGTIRMSLIDRDGYHELPRTDIYNKFVKDKWTNRFQI